jgi:flagellar biosynthetic protein FliR
VDSYTLFDAKAALPAGDMSDMIAHRLSESFAVGLRLSAPFVIVSMGVFIAMGLVARLVPQIQVFVVSMPVQIAVGLLLMMTTISAMMMFFLTEYQDSWLGVFSGQE